jgi:nucleoid DNA-binding protein
LVGTEFKFIFTKMDILSYLTDLLKTQKEVGIVGLGTFFKKKIPGKYDAVNHLFIPPSYELQFSTEVEETTRLSQYVSSVRNVSDESAQYYIGLFKDEIQRQLAISNEADLDTLGKLYYNDGELILTDQGNTNLGFEFYGLPQISTGTSNDEQEIFEEINEVAPIVQPAPRIIIETQETLIEEEAEQKVVIGEEDEVKEAIETEPEQKEFVEKEAEVKQTIETEPEQEDPIEDTPVFISEQEVTTHTNSANEANSTTDANQGTIVPSNTESEERIAASPTDASNIWHFDKERLDPAFESKAGMAGTETKSTNSAWKVVLIIVAILLAMAALVYFLRPDLFGNRVGRNPKPVFADTVATTVPMPPVDTTLTTDSATTAGILADTTAKVATPDVKANAVVTDLTTWEIIGASLTKNEVHKYIRDMKARGYTAKPVPTLPGRKRIKMSIATFPDEQSAKEGRIMLIKKLNNKDLYIFENKNTQKPL